MKTNYSKKYIIISLILMGFLPYNSFSQSSKLNDALRTETITNISKMLTDFYVYPETGKKMVTQLNNNLKSGKYNNIEAFGQFASALADDLFKIAKDNHLRIYYSPSQVKELKQFNSFSELEKEEYLKKENEKYSRTNFGFEKLEIINNNIGYLKLNRFDFVNMVSSETASAAMNFLANTEVIIIDLRDNEGGSLTMVQLLSSYFFDYSEFDNLVLFESNIVYKNEVIPYRVLPNLHGKRMIKKPLYILINKNSFSAAEIFAYTLQKLGRATIIGEQTHFGVNGSQGFNIVNEYYTISIPVQRIISPITKTNCEGIGVIPDIKIDGRNALDKSLEVIIAKQNENKPKEKLSNPDENLKQYTGEYLFNPETKMNVSVKGIQVFVEITGRPQPFEIFQIGEDKYNVPGFGIEVTFLRENGIVTALNFSRNGNESFAKKNN